ncbi:DUF4062 domain-containing protein [Psychrobacter okhotskensis]|uniref:DUF4062 domain-containing protein n=1 Tax=Psychrobacter okhotskensis TaxID=212403 RepID=UPI00191816DA|nr:DUF4062 domain-containing protein [Psychrobacter okhotskensis]
MNKKPTFFISSTIYDFRDLRSALKFYLEELGYQVYASEYNDFKVASDKHSYDACLKLVEECDYFILLVGSRVGGFYDTENKISITRQEYREAYKLHEQGKLQIISFVRDEVWQLKETRNELAKHLKEMKTLDEEIRNEVLNFDTKFANDADLISNFITEIGKNNETRHSLKNGDVLPTGNWIRQFKGFEDIIAGLKPFIVIEDLNVKFHKELLKNELLKHSLCLHGNFKENPQFIMLEFDKIYQAIPAINSIYNDVVIHKDIWDEFFVAFYLNCLMPINIDLNVLYKVLTTDVFYEYEVSTNTLVKHPIYDAILQLKDKLVSCENMKEKSKNYHSQLSDISKQFPNRDVIAISPIHLLEILMYFANIADIHLLSVEIIKSLASGIYKSPQLCDIHGLTKKLLVS